MKAHDDLDDDFFDIDPDSLPELWCGFAKKYYKQARRLADARAEHERAKAQRDVVYAEVDKDIRLKPEEYGLSKLTEPVVEKTVMLSKKYQSAVEEVIIAKHTVDIITAAVDALEGQKKGLENSVQLMLAGFRAEPKAKGEAGKAMADAKIDRALGARKHSS